MTNAELVEGVAREVLQHTQVRMGKKRTSTTAFFPIEDTEFGVMRQAFDPLNDMNDLFMVLDKFRYYKITKHIGGVDCILTSYAGETVIAENCATEADAVLQAALKAKGEGDGKRT